MLACCRDQYCITLSFYVYKEILIIKTFCILRLIESTASQSQATVYCTEASRLVCEWQISALQIHLTELTENRSQRCYRISSVLLNILLLFTRSRVVANLCFLSSAKHKRRILYWSLSFMQLHWMGIKVFKFQNDAH